MLNVYDLILSCVETCQIEQYQLSGFSFCFVDYSICRGSMMSSTTVIDSDLQKQFRFSHTQDKENY